jgi:hypothetical protein
VFSLPDSPSRTDVLAFISRAASYGNLGAFIGAGFSKAVLNDGTSEIALSWGDLLKQASANLKIDYDAIWKEGVSYPDVASAICSVHSESVPCEYSRSLSLLKREIAALTSWLPDKSKRETFAKYLEALSPSWIITTNYDLIIESLLTGKSIPLGPNDSLSSQKGVIPVFHLHGIRTNPDDIIIAQEDYVALFRPSEYRQIKLALTIKESTTLLLGYGLGDVNVLTALDWSRNVFRSEQPNYPNGVIQVLRKDNPHENPYRDRHGIVIIETSDLATFFDEFLAVRRDLLKVEQEEQSQLSQLAAELDDPGSKMIEQFIDDASLRAQMLKMLSKFSIHLISGFVTFLNKCIDETWVRSSSYGAFEGYNQNLRIILDILTAFPIHKFPPALFQTVAYALHRVSPFIGSSPGQSWSAHDTWASRKGELTKETLAELRSLAIQHGYSNLELLLHDVDA